MDFKVVVTQAALDDLDQIVGSISRDNPRAARRLGVDLMQRAESLSGSPKRGMAMNARPGVRRLVRNPYLIIYRLDEDIRVVSILRFWHQSRELKSLRLD